MIFLFAFAKNVEVVHSLSNVFARSHACQNLLVVERDIENIDGADLWQCKLAKDR